jgi:hypothetical protein
LILNSDISTGYPPLTEILFAANHLLKFGEFGLRLISVVSSLGVGVVLMKILRQIGEDERKAIVYAWSPLVALEFGNSGHFDSLAIFVLTLAFFMHVKRKPMGTALFLALGGLIKFFPALLAPIWGRRWGWRTWLIFISVSFLPWVPFVSGGSPFAGLGVFASRGDFNASLYGIFQQIWDILLLPSHAQLAARLTTLVVLILVVIILTRKTWHSMDPAADWRFAYLVMGWSLLMSPVVHPWYLCWMLAFISIQWETGWLVLSGSVIFSRYVYLGLESTGTWHEPIWSRWAVYLPFYLAYFLPRMRHYHGKNFIAGFAKPRRFIEGR